MYDLIILGGGPAGIAAGIYASRKKLKALLITESFGGQSIVAAQINNFIGFKSLSGLELKNALEEHLRAHSGIEIMEGCRMEKVEKTDAGFLITAGGEKFESKTILIASGSHHRRLNIPGEKKFEGRGVFYCSICDAPLMNNKPAVVVGGGNSALYAVFDLLPYADKIFVLGRSNIFRADPVYLEKAASSKKVQFIANAESLEILGDKFVSAITYKDKTGGTIKELRADGIFVAIGNQPNSELFKGLVTVNQAGKIIVDGKTQQTSREGVWAAGDITDVLYGQINIAIGDAVKAVLNINDYLKIKK